MRTLSVSCVVLAMSAALTAQSTNPTAYPQAGTDGSSGILVPFGYSSSSPNVDEGRFQQLIPARYLPSTGCAILGINVLSQVGISSTYTSLDITMSLVPPGGTLSPTFANNLPAPVTVYSKTNHTITWQRRVWQTIPLDVPFVHDGVSDLVVDIQKTYDRVTNPPTGIGHHQTSSNPGRSDLPATRYSLSPLGGGGATATTASSSSRPMKLGFEIAGLPTFTVEGSRGGANNNVFAIGGQFTSSLRGTPGMLFGSLISLGWSPAPLPVAGIGGMVHIDILSAIPYASGMIGTSGVESLTWGIPNDPALVGALLTFQGVSQDANNLLVLSNAADLLISD